MLRRSCTVPDPSCGVSSAQEFRTDRPASQKATAEPCHAAPAALANHSITSYSDTLRWGNERRHSCKSQRGCVPRGQLPEAGMMSDDGKAVHQTLPQNGISLTARVSYLETILGILGCVLGIIGGWWTYSTPRPHRVLDQPMGIIGVIFFSLCAVFYVRHFFRKGILYRVDSEGVFVHGKTISPIHWRHITSVRETRQRWPLHKKVMGYTLHIDEIGRSLLRPNPVTRRPGRKLWLTGTGYDVSGSQIGEALSFYLPSLLPPTHPDSSNTAPSHKR